MKKLLILIAALFIVAIGYYFTFGSQKVADELKAQVDTQLQILQKNGFGVEERKTEARKEHFVLEYADPVKINHYLNSKNVELTPQDAQMLKGLKIGVDLSYLDGTYSAVSADLYPVAFPLSSMQEATPDEKKIMEKIIQDKLFLAHVDINKLFTAFKGSLKDIDTTFESEDPLTLVSKGFVFDGTYDDHTLSSSSNAIKQLSITARSGASFSLSDLEGKYEQKGKSHYDFTSEYKVDSLLITNGSDQGASLKELEFESSGEAKDDLARSKSKLELKSADITEPGGKHRFENLSGKISLKNLSIVALDKMNQLDENDADGLKEALKILVSKGITLDIDTFSVKKISDESTGKMVDGFDINALVKIDKNADAGQLEQNPLALLDSIDASTHLEFSNELYLMLQKRPELAMAMLFFTPVSKGDKMSFDIEYKQGVLKVNGKPAL